MILAWLSRFNRDTLVRLYYTHKMCVQVFCFKDACNVIINFYALKLVWVSISVYSGTSAAWHTFLANMKIVTYLISSENNNNIHPFVIVVCFINCEILIKDY